MSIYIHSTAHISNQEPFVDKWFTKPIIYNERYVRSIEPDFSIYIPPAVSRRMGKILKRALATSLYITQKTKIEKPDAIITGTGLGCIEHTEKFITTMLDNNEDFLSPTYFMQSTHNTISSQIALHLKCNSYNNTYCHRGTSFDSALLDAYLQFELGEIQTAMVNGHDELTPDYFLLLDKIGYWKQGEISEQILRTGNTQGSFAGECSICFMLGNSLKPNSLCQLKGIELMYQPSKEQLLQTINNMLQVHNLTINDIDAIVTGISGDRENDNIYKDMYSFLFPRKHIIWYKHIFGESYTASGLGTYVAATILHKASLPEHLVYSYGSASVIPKNILLYNHFQNKDHSLILLSSCSN
ncbi:MAG: beta-ketoacyl synthase chain length factor [Bacteroidales bacterium]|jgi:3-oxoacyl-(acyl-carrier-protein) synthase|nr:beta-ketoacyl synthase chain length factor [Bacteroidales bacterium]